MFQKFIWLLSVNLLSAYICFIKGSNGLMDKVSASQPRDRGFEPHTGHDHDSSNDTSTGWFRKRVLGTVV